jgi:putative ABC transport system permease protein
MLTNYLKIALRNLLRHKIYSAINIVGLAVGVACCIVIVLYVADELGVDRFHRNGDHIYRLMRKTEISGTSGIAAPWTSAQFTPLLRNAYPDEIRDIVRVLPTDGLMRNGNKAFKEPHVVFADPNFFTVFSYPLVQGNPASVLTNPNSIVISQAVAQKYFGSESPIGKVLQFENKYDCLVTGVFSASSGNSHLEFDIVGSLGMFAERPWFTQIMSNNLYTYLRLADNVRAEELEAKLKQFVGNYFNESSNRTGSRLTLQLQALRDIYFYAAPPYVCARHGDKSNIYLFSLIAAIILSIACMNFMNLATARSIGRAKEVGMRKVMGAYRVNLIFQFLGESVLISGIAILVALVLVELMLPAFNAFSGRTLSVPYSDPMSVLLLLASIIVVGVIAGSYPAFFLSSFQPVVTLKGKFKARRSSVLFRSGLVVMQFVISTMLIIGTIVMMQQLQFMNTKSLGFDKEQTVLVKIDNADIYENRERFKSLLLQNPVITSVSAMSGEPGGFHDSFAFTVQGKEHEAQKLRTVFTDEFYAKTLGIKLVTGRDFSRSFANDAQASILLNESAVRHLGWRKDEAVGKILRMNMRDTSSKMVVGIVEDFHFSSLKEDIEPLAISISDDQRVFAVKLRAGNIGASIAAIEQVWHIASPKHPFEYTFLDESYARLYKNEQQQRTLMGTFSIIAIVVSCLGLFGLTAFTAESRMKEIGVRKVLGASVTSIIGLLSKDFLRLVGVAILIAAPLSYWLSRKWLQDFAYHMDLSWWVFALSGAVAVVIAFATVASQAWRAARQNPVNTLRSE